jgi:hypothetical protein
VEIVPGEIHIDEKGNLKTADDLKTEVERLKQLRENETLPSEPLAPAAPAPPPAPDGMVEPIVVSPQEPPKPHELLDPVDHKSSYSSPFSADTQSADWVDPYDSVSIDPLSGSSSPLSQSSQSEDPIDHIKMVEPPVEPPQLTPAIPALDNARSAVENAIGAAPADSAFLAPVDALNAQPIGPDLHTSINPNIRPTAYAAEKTPSLQLPTESAAPSPTPIPDMAPPAPPPVPPPLMPTPNAPTANGGAPGQPLF